MGPNKEQAKQVILEIIRQTGGDIGKTKLFKTFWIAHLFYAKSAPGYLSDWPIVRMPKGPGIHHAEKLIGELAEEGKIERSLELRGPFTEINCKLKVPVESRLPEAAIKAIANAVEFLKGHTAESISELSHIYSRCWNSQKDGDELDIYTDLISDEEYQEQKEEMSKMRMAYEKLFE